MKVISLNLHGHQEENEVEKLNRIVEYIKNNEIDVCLFQEVSQKIDNQYLFDNIKEDNNAYYIAKKLGYNLYYRDLKIGFDIYQEGLAIVSRYPIEEEGLHNLSKTSNYNSWLRRCALKAKINGFHFISVHLGWDCQDEKFIDQSTQLLKLISNKTIIGGDFNFPDRTDQINYMKKNLRSAHDIFNINSDFNPTFHFDLDSSYHSNNKMIDYFFLSHDIKISEYKIIFNTPDDYVSDHSLIYINVK